ANHLNVEDTTTLSEYQVPFSLSGQSLSVDKSVNGNVSVEIGNEDTARPDGLCSYEFSKQQELKPIELRRIGSNPTEMAYEITACEHAVNVTAKTHDSRRSEFELSVGTSLSSKDIESEKLEEAGPVERLFELSRQSTLETTKSTGNANHLNVEDTTTLSEYQVPFSLSGQSLSVDKSVYGNVSVEIGNEDTARPDGQCLPKFSKQQELKPIELRRIGKGPTENAHEISSSEYAVHVTPETHDSRKSASDFSVDTLVLSDNVDTNRPTKAGLVERFDDLPQRQKLKLIRTASNENCLITEENRTLSETQLPFSLSGKSLSLVQTSILGKENFVDGKKNTADPGDECLFEFPIRQKLNPFELIGCDKNFIGEQTMAPPSEKQPLCHVSSEFSAYEAGVNFTKNDQDRASPNAQPLHVLPVGLTHCEKRPSTEKNEATCESKGSHIESDHQYMELTDETLVIGRSVPDKFGRHALCNLSIRNQRLAMPKDVKEKMNPTISASVLKNNNLPRRRNLFPAESTVAGYDIQEDQFGDTVVFSLKRKLPSQIDEQASIHLSRDDNFLVSPLRKKIITTMRGKDGSSEEAETTDTEDSPSTVFLLKRKLHCPTKKNRSKKSPSKKTSCSSPLKKKARRSKVGNNRGSFSHQGEATALLKSSFDSHSSVQMSAQTNLCSADSNVQVRPISIGSSFTRASLEKSDRSLSNENASDIKCNSLSAPRVKRRTLRPRAKLQSKWRMKFKRKSSRARTSLGSLKGPGKNASNPISEPSPHPEGPCPAPPRSTLNSATATPLSERGQRLSIAEEEPFTPVSRFMRRMRVLKAGDNRGIRVRALPPAQRAIPRGGDTTLFSKVDQPFNPTFKKLKNFLRIKKSQKNVFRLRNSEAKLRNSLARRFKRCSLASASTQARCLIKWAMVARRRLIVMFQKAHESLKTKCEKWVDVAENYSAPSELGQRGEALLGVRKHSSVTDPFFVDTAYKAIKLRIKRTQMKSPLRKRVGIRRNREVKNLVPFPSLNVDEEGKVRNIFPETQPLKKSLRWDCSALCNTSDRTAIRKVGKVFRRLKQTTLGQMVHFLVGMNECRNTCHLSCKKGHSAVCRMTDGNGAPLVVLQNLMSHYPHVRTAVRSLQTMKKILSEIDELDTALYTADREKLEAIAEKARLQGGEFTIGGDTYTDEDGIYMQFKKCFAALDKAMNDLPSNYCFSCEKILKRDQLIELSRMKSTPDNHWWNELYKKGETGVCVDYICKFCLKKIRKGELPSIATLNKMDVPKVPPSIQGLNKFERIFIQRAKAFQVVAKAGTVSGKHLPASHLNSKVVGRTFHLPLPLEETLKRVLRDEQAVMPNQELYLLIRGLPTNQKKVWEHLVNFSDILKALQWLKTHNDLYKQIVLPEKAEDFLQQLEEIIYDDPDNPSALPHSNASDDDPDNPSTVPPSSATADDPDNPSTPPHPSASQRESQSEALPVGRSSPDPDDSNEDECDDEIRTPGGPKKTGNLRRDSQRDESPVKNLDLSDELSDIGALPEDRRSAPSNSDDEESDQAAPSSLAEIAAMITQRSKDDAFYDNYSIVPLYDSRENKSSSELFQMKKVEGAIIDSRAPLLDAQCFPDLFPDGRNYFNEERDVPIEFSEFAKAKLMSRHSQFRMNTQYLFFLNNQKTNREIAAGIYQTLNITRTKRTAGDFLEKLGEEELERDMCSIFQRVRNTEQFWKVPLAQLIAMIDNYGPATFFFTFSPSLYDDPEVDEYLRKMRGDEEKGKTTSVLIAEDAISIAQFCDQKLKAMMNFLTASKDGPLGEVIHYHVRREYQSRGAPHFHILLWIKDAPILGKASSEDVATFIQKHITCSVPDAKTFPELHKKVVTYQTHRDNRYCTRMKQFKDGKLPVCRFGFPRPVTDKLVLRDVPTAVAGRRNLKANSRLYDLPRKKGEERINDYNPALLLAVGYGNMDIQFVGEKSGIVARYISKYVCKPEKSRMEDVFSSINSLKTLRQKLWSVASRCLSHRECHAIEAADALLGKPLHFTDKDTSFKWVDVGMFRSRKLKKKGQIEQIAKEDPKSTNLYCPSLVDNHYPNRPAELNGVSLYDFASQYDIITVQPTKPGVVFFPYPDFGYVRKRSKLHLVNHYNFDPRQKPEEYFYSLLLLFKPWRKIDDLKGSHATFTEAFKAEQDSLHDALQYHHKRSAIEAAREEIARLIEEKSAEFEEEPEDINLDADEDPYGFRANEAAEAVKEYREAANKIDEVEDLKTLESMLNEDQLRVYDFVKSTLDSNTPMRHFVSGVGGTGKSFLIKTIAKYVRETKGKDVAICAPTGMAASAISGQTLHRLLQLPVQHGNDLKYSRLSDTVLNILRLALKQTVILIIDEISMVSSLMLMFIHLRLSEIFNTFEEENAFFGNLHIMVFGDLLQLPPVDQNPPYESLSDGERVKHFGSMADFNLWKNLFTYDELLINMRQKSDPSFCELLANVRLGRCTNADVKKLLERKLEFKTINSDARTKELAQHLLDNPDKPVCLLPKKRMCKRLNDAVLSLLPGKEVDLHARDSVDGRLSDKQKALKKLEKLEGDCSRTAGLDKTIKVKEGARVMLLRNIDVTLGYVNGAVGTITEVITKNKTPKQLKLQMQNGRELSLDPVVAKFEIIPGVFVHREQFPVSLAYGITIHKSQGLSLDCAFVDVGDQTFSQGQIYVALSRVKTLAGLTVINFNPAQVSALPSALREYQRLRTMVPHLKSMAKQLKVNRQRKQCIQDDVWAPRLETGNAVDETPPPKKMMVSSLLPPFENEDNVACYANATLQCLLSHELLRNALRRLDGDSALKQLAEEYVKPRNGKPLSAFNVREATGDDFSESKMQEPIFFYLCLVNQSDVLKQMTAFTEVLQRQCTSCKAVIEISDERHMVQMPTEHKKVSEFLQRRSSWSEPKDFVCPQCHEKTEAAECLVIRNPSELFAVVVLLWSPSVDGERRVKNDKFQMTALQGTNIKVDEHRYRLHAAVFHSGKGVVECHHTAVVQFGTRVVLADDCDISECKWPRGSKGASLLFYSKFDGEKPPSKTGKPTARKNAASEGSPKSSLARPLPTDKTTAAASEAPKNAVAKRATGKRRNVVGKQLSDYRNEASNPLPAFSNPDLSCYANSDLQCLLSYEPLRCALSSSADETALKRLATDYVTAANRGKKLTSFHVRQEVDLLSFDGHQIPYSDPAQQDAQLFLVSLINCHAILNEHTKFTVLYERKCGFDMCGKTNRSEPQLDNVFRLPTVHSHRTIAELLEIPSTYQNIEDYTCPTCGQKSTAQERTVVQNPSQLFIIQLLCSKRD
ncbi:unnamed protein product, partial [Bemisia tabaci]